MNHPTHRSALLGAMLVGLGFLGSIPSAILRASRARPLPGSAPPTHQRSRARAFRGVKRYWLKINGKVVKFPAGSSRPAGYGGPLSPKVDGRRMRWADDQLVPRWFQTTPAKRRRAEKASPQQVAQPRRRAYDPNKGVRRFDAVGAARAARRAGVISARQQRKVHKAARRELKRAEMAKAQAELRTTTYAAGAIEATPA